MQIISQKYLRIDWQGLDIYPDNEAIGRQCRRRPLLLLAPGGKFCQENSRDLFHSDDFLQGKEQAGFLIIPNIAYYAIKLHYMKKKEAG